MANSTSKKKLPVLNKWVSSMITDTSALVSFEIIEGLIGNSNEPNHTRIYLNPSLDHFLDVPNDLISHFEQNDVTDGPYALTKIWIKKEGKSNEKNVEITQNNLKDATGNNVESQNATWGESGTCPTKSCWTNNWTCPSEHNACRTDINYPHPFCRTEDGSLCTRKNNPLNVGTNEKTWGDEGTCPTKTCWTNNWTCPSEHNACRTDINYPHPFCRTEDGSLCTRDDNSKGIKTQDITWGDAGSCPTKGCWTNSWTCPSEHNACRTDLGYPHPFCKTESGSLCKRDENMGTRDWATLWNCASQGISCRTEITYPHPFCKTESGSLCKRDTNENMGVQDWASLWSCPTKGIPCRTKDTYGHPFCK